MTLSNRGWLDSGEYGRGIVNMRVTCPAPLSFSIGRNKNEKNYYGICNRTVLC